MISGIYRSPGGRDVNEDSVCLEIARTETGECAIAVVCDGIGSLDAGEVASGYVTECLVRWFYRTGIRMGHSSKNRIKRSLGRCLYDAHIHMKSTAGKRNIRMGTTCSFVCIWRNRYVCVHVGDSAVHLIGKRNCRRLTDKQRTFDGKLAGCVGSMGYYAADFSFGRLRSSEGILVSSDGFHDPFSEEEIGQMLKMDGEVSEERIGKRLAFIGSESAGRGQTDNRSAVYIRRQPYGKTG